MKQRLISALQKCAQAHHVECAVYDDDPNDVQVSFLSVSVPLISDLRMIAEAFFGKTMCVVSPDYGWGFTNFFVDYWPFRNEIDENLLALALPYGTES